MKQKEPKRIEISPEEIDRYKDLIDSSNYSSDRKKKKRKGHGRNRADSYTGAKRVYVSLESLHIGDRCPECEKGNLYDTDDPGTIVSIVGQAS